MDEDRLRYEGWRVAAASGVGVFFAALQFYTFSVFLKPLAEEFSWSREAVSSAFGLMAGMVAVSSPLLGHLFDRLGVRRIVGPCMVLSACAIASLSMLTPRLWNLYLVFALLGVAGSGSSALPHSRAVSTWFDRRRGMALALVMAGGALGGMVHPPVAQALIRLLGWRGAYLVLGGLILAAGLPVVLRFVRERPADRNDTAASTAGASLQEALRSRAFWILVIVVFGSTVASNGTIVHLSALLTDRGVSVSRAAIAVSAMGGASLAGRLLTGWLLDRFPAVRVSFALLVTAALGIFLLAGARSFTAGVLSAVLIGFGIGGESDVTPYLLSRYFGLRSMATLYGLAWTALGFAGVVGPILMGRAFDATGSYEAVLVQLAVGALGAAALMLTLPACPVLSSCPDPVSAAQ